MQIVYHSSTPGFGTSIAKSVGLNKCNSLRQDFTQLNLQTSKMPSPEVLLDLFDREEWNEVVHLVDEYPYLGASTTVDLILQGETIHCSPLHVACSYKETPLAVIDALITANTAAVLRKDNRGGRLPIHVAILRSVSPNIVKHLLQVSPESLLVADSDGNLPLHLAAMYASSSLQNLELLELLLVKSPPIAFAAANENGRTPLHLLCASSSREACTALAPRMVQIHPQALLQADRNGRLPIHVACNSGQDWSVVECLLEHHPSSGSGVLLLEDFNGKTPVQLASERHSKTNRALCRTLQERVRQERRQQNWFQQRLTGWARLRAQRRRRKESLDLHRRYS